ncbi:MAG: hypothetical protein SWK90_10570 [Chloroflexota bacterium]|nr:hypothetical protein [Chloroflexota bacterium]
MFEQTVETSATPHVTVTECLGNLMVRGSEARQVTIQVQDGADDTILEREGETFTLVARAGCLISCPPATTITVGTVRGNIKIKGVEGPVTIGTVHGNVNLRAVGPTALEQASGNLSVRQAAGDLRVQTLRGNARAHQVEGSLSLSQVDGNLVAEGLQGGLAAEQVRGNVRLGPPFSPGAAYRLSSGGNLKVRLPADASLRLALGAGGRARSHIPDLVLEETEGETRGVLGAGEASLEAQAGGNVTLRLLDPAEGQREDMLFGFATDMEEVGAQIESRIAEAMAEMAARLEESLGHIDDQAIRERVERAAEKSLRKAGQAAGRARRKAEREAERARLRAERAERRWQRASGQRPRPKQEPATDEERMRVLHLVEEGKITPGQAADLLAALNGR